MLIATAMLKQKLWGKEEKTEGHGKNKQLVLRKTQKQTDEDEQRHGNAGPCSGHTYPLATEAPKVFWTKF